MDLPESGTVRCPTCRASQEWSDACRRCKSDLRLLRRLAGRYAAARARCLRSLAQGRPATALAAARECRRIDPNPESLRLLAVSALLAGDWHTAVSP